VGYVSPRMRLLAQFCLSNRVADIDCLKLIICRHILVIDTSVFAKSNMGRRDYYFEAGRCARTLKQKTRNVSYVVRQSIDEPSTYLLPIDPINQFRVCVHMKANRGLNYIHAGYSIDRVHACMHACFFFTTSYVRTTLHTHLTRIGVVQNYGGESNRSANCNCPN
jgi:hypothetical protein